jgi:hypothetical protein
VESGITDHTGKKPACLFLFGRRNSFFIAGSIGNGKREKTGVLGIWILGIRDIRGYIRLVMKSPQFRLILTIRSDQDHSRSQEIVNYRSLFLGSWIFRVYRKKWLEFEIEKCP